jgi:hypothetical protein
MGEPPTPKHTLDRFPNRNGNYEPGNVRWATAKEQARNTDATRTLTVNGETRPLTEWAEILGVDGRKLHLRLKRGWTEEETVLGRNK